MPLEHQVRLTGTHSERLRRRQQRARDRAVARDRWRAGEAHDCGLKHLPTGDGWSPFAALIWWMLRSGPSGRR